MKIIQYIFISAWREAGLLARCVWAAFILLPAAAAFAFALLGGTWSKEYLPWWVLAEIALLMIFLALIYNISRRAQSLEEKSKPNLDVTYGNFGIYCSRSGGGSLLTTIYRVGVRNSSNEIIRGVELVLANIVGISDVETEEHRSQQLKPVDQETGRIDLNPGAIKYYKLLEVEQFLAAMDEECWMNFGPLMEQQTVKMRRGTYRVKLRVSGENSPDAIAYLEVGFDNQNLLYLKGHDGTLEEHIS